MTAQKEFHLESYLTAGVENIVKGAMRATLKDPKESAFLLSFAAASKKATGIRSQWAEKGEHIPPFLIASITSRCNLHCSGCYARTNNSCADSEPAAQLTDKEWLCIFQEGRELGISFILLAGGEPFLRRDVVEAAAKVPEILFPVFTNGTMMDQRYLQLFEQNRNLVPIFSIEGDEMLTDQRRGTGTYERLMEVMEQMKQRHLIFGTSVTVTTENKEAVTSPQFLDRLYALDCKAVIYVEYVPVTEESRELAFGDQERSWFERKLPAVREGYPEMVFIAFPGDEKSSGGCLAAGRGFFHINSHGGAEPCPFSPYSDSNVKETSLREALHSRLFTLLHEQELLMEDHQGGCVLFEKRDQVEDLLAR